LENNEIINLDSLFKLIGRDRKNRYYCLELLRFFGAHPNTRFNRLAVIHVLSEEGSKLEVERALVHLTDKGVVKSCIESNAHLYILTKDEAIRRLVLELARLEWSQWQLILRQNFFPVKQSRQYHIGSRKTEDSLF
jgi:hypothetical protein